MKTATGEAIIALKKSILLICMRRKIYTRGFTLIEIIVAMLVLAVAVGGLLCSFLMGKQAAGRARRNSAALELTRDVIEYIRDEVDADLWHPNAEQELSNGLHTTEPFLEMGATELGSVFGGSREYRVQWYDADSTVDTDGDGNSANDRDFKGVTVRVVWSEP